MELYIVTVNGQPQQLFNNRLLAGCTRDPTIFTNLFAAEQAAEKTLKYAQDKNYPNWSIVQAGYNIQRLPFEPLLQILQTKRDEREHKHRWETRFVTIDFIDCASGMQCDDCGEVIDQDDVEIIVNALQQLETDLFLSSGANSEYVLQGHCDNPPNKSLPQTGTAGG